MEVCDTVIVFDFDGTLVDTNEIKRDAYIEIFRELGLEALVVVKETVDLNIDGDRLQQIDLILRQLEKHGMLSGPFNEPSYKSRCIASYNTICEEYAYTCPIIPGADQAIARLRENYKLYINSATPKEPLDRIVERRGWKKCFRGVYGSMGSKVANLEAIAQSEVASPGAIVMIGDDDRDLRAAMSFGCRFVGVVHRSSSFCQRPPRFVRNLTDLVDLVPEVLEFPEAECWPAAIL